MTETDLCAFVANGSILSRESGVSPRPMKGAVKFSCPQELEVTMDLPHKGRIRGMGIPKGITLIVGGGYHGKSTLLNALESGVYNHIAGDGREYVITDESAVNKKNLAEIVNEPEAVVGKGSPAALSESGSNIPCMAMPRRQEIFACFNCYRSLRM